MKPLQDKRRWTIWHCPNHGWVDRTAECRVCEGGLDSIEVVPVSSLDQALAERDRLAEVAEELAEALIAIRYFSRGPDHKGYGDACGEDACAVCLIESSALEALQKHAPDMLAHYESLRGEADG